jgi:hypothetical protein
MFKKNLIANRDDNRRTAKVAAKPHRLASETSGDRAAGAR